MRIVMLAALLLAACGAPEPHNQEVEAPAWAAEMEEAAVQEWSGRLGIEVGALPRVRWFAGSCLEYDAGTEGLPDVECATGMTWVGVGIEPEIHLLASKPLNIAHEALHWALHERDDGDPNGAHDDAAWSQVPEVEATVSQAQL